MHLETMHPDPDWDPSDHEDTIDTLQSYRDELTIRVWGGDWCGDCQAVLPPFAAALEAAGIDPQGVEHYPVEKEDDGTKVGPLVEAYDVAYIPTIVFERDGVEVARFVESEPVDAATYLAEQLRELESRA